MMKKKNSRGEMLVENVVFIILNLVFLSILIVFLTSQSSNGKVLEEVYAKEIALMVDSAKPSMTIMFDMSKAKKVSDKNEFDFSNVVKKSGNSIIVQLSPEGGYEYYFFNDIDIEVYPDRTNENEYTGKYFLTIN